MQLAIVECRNLFPEGRTYSLNSKRLTASELTVIATMLKQPGGESVTKTRQLFKGRLLEIGHEPRNVQVVIQASDEALKPNKIFLVDESGIIRESEEHSSRPLSEVSGVIRGSGDQSPRASSPVSNVSCHDKTILFNNVRPPPHTFCILQWIMETVTQPSYAVHCARCVSTMGDSNYNWTNSPCYWKSYPKN